MISWYLATLLVLTAFLFMEFVAWFSHKYIMHGFLWILHKDHHIRDGRRVEWNDAFAVIFALPAIVFTITGVSAGFDWKFYIGIGITAYGAAYFIFHDVLVHNRLPFLNKLSNRYLRATITAHMDHHKPNAMYNYGFLLAPLKYYKSEWAKSRTVKQE